MQTAGLVGPCGAQAPIVSGQRKMCFSKVSFGRRPAVFTTRVPAKASRSSRSQRLAAVTVTASTASSNGNVLPWQAAMDEVKKRKVLKSIMIIGAGPIVIGQVGARWSHLTATTNPSYVASINTHASAHTVRMHFKLQP